MVTRPSIEERLAAAGLGPLPRLAWLEIDLDALRGNLRAIRTIVGPGVRVEPVVKADAYGHGAVPVARTLEGAGADGFCVAAFDEAVELRRAGVRAPILVLYPVPPEVVALAARGRIAVSAGGGVQLDRMLAAGSAAAGRGRRRLEVHLEIETGLGRGGVAIEDAAAVAVRIGTTRGVRLVGVWTHLQAAEDPGRTARQLEGFDRAIAALRDAGVKIPRRHVAASGMLLGGAVAAHDAVRPGLSLYGIVPEELGPGADAHAERAGLRPALSLYARPVRVADLPAGWGIGYGPTHVTARPGRIRDAPPRLRRRLGARALEPGRGARPWPSRPDRRECLDGWDRRRRDRCPRATGGWARRVRAHRLPGRRADHGTAGGAGPHHEYLGGRHGHGSTVTAGVPCLLRGGGIA